MCERVCVCKRERVCVCVCERKKESMVCVCVWERERVCVCVVMWVCVLPCVCCGCESDRERESVCECVCVWMWQRESVYVSVCVWLCVCVWKWQRERVCMWVCVCVTVCVDNLANVHCRCAFSNLALYGVTLLEGQVVVDQVSRWSFSLYTSLGQDQDDFILPCGSWQQVSREGRKTLPLHEHVGAELFGTKSGLFLTGQERWFL